MRAKKRKIVFQLKFLGIILVIIFFSAVFIYQYKGYLALVEEEKILKKEIEILQTKEDELIKSKNYYNTDSYIEKIAREQLNMLKQNEIKVIVNEK